MFVGVAVTSRAPLSILRHLSSFSGSSGGTSKSILRVSYEM